MSDPSLDALARLAADARACLDARDDHPTWETAESLARGLVAAVDALRAERDRRDAERLAIADALELQPIAMHEQCVDAARVLSGALTNALDTLGAQSRLLEAKHTPEDGVSLLVSAVLGFADDAPNSVEFCGTWLGRRFHLTVQWTDGQTPGEMLTEMQGERDAAIARATAADDRRDALAAAVREVGGLIAEHGCSCDCDCTHTTGEHTSACDPCLACRASDVVSPLLRGAAPDVVRAGVVRAYLTAEERWREGSGVYLPGEDVTAYVARREAERVRVSELHRAMVAALAAAEGR